MQIKNDIYILFYGLAFISVILGLFFYFYETKSTGWLPVISNPMRELTIPMFSISLILFLIAIILQIHRWNNEAE